MSNLFEGILLAIFLTVSLFFLGFYITGKLKKKEATATMPTLHEDILEEIFLKLPRKSLARFRCLSKSLCELFDSHSFQGMYHELENLKTNASVALGKHKGKTVFTIDYKSISSLLPLSTKSSATISECRKVFNRMDYPSMFPDCDEVETLYSVRNRLRLIRTTTKSNCVEFCIWYPTTKVCKKIPMAREVNNNNISGYGFGWDNKTGDYKLVRIDVDHGSKCSNVDVYALSSNSWKSPQVIPYQLYYKRYYGLYFSGALHWLAKTFEQDSIIYLLCFDVVNDRFQDLALPEEPMQEPFKGDMSSIGLWEFGGCLCLCFHVLNVRVDVWIMQDYGVKESWAKINSTTLESITSRLFPRLVGNFKNSETLWVADAAAGVLILHDPINNIYKKLEFDLDFDDSVAAAEKSM